jgi:hypothetical protein
MTTIRKALIAIAIILLGGGALSQQGAPHPKSPLSASPHKFKPMAVSSQVS